MSLRAADIRFILPTAPRTAWVSPALGAVRRGFEQADVTIEDRRPDVAVGMAADTGPDRASGPPAWLIIGRGRLRQPHGGQPAVRRFLALPRPLEPHLIVPADRPAVASYAIDAWTGADSSLRRIRNQAAARVIRAGLFPEISRSVRLTTETAAPPFIVAPACELGVPAGADWFLTLGLGDAHTRAVFQLFAPGEHDPRWALKFSRVAGHFEPFERDERGLRLAASCPPAAAHAPRLLGRFEVAGLPASLEEATAGRRLTYLLQLAGARAEKLRVVNAIASWIVELGRVTAAPADRLEAERRRLEGEVLPFWRGQAAADLLARLPSVPAVMQHNDLATHNLVVGAGTFTAVDWESARAHGLPLWDLVYFLVDALIHLDRAWSLRETHAARLLRGETRSSAILFRWVRAAVQSLGLSDDAVGPILTLGWLHHGLAAARRAGRPHALVPDQRSAATYGEWMAQVWLTAPGLGPEWSAWRT